MRRVGDGQKRNNQPAAGSFAELAQKEEARKARARLRTERKKNPPAYRSILAAVCIPYFGAGFLYALVALIRTALGTDMEGSVGTQLLHILKIPLIWPWLVAEHLNYRGMVLEDFLALAVFAFLLLALLSRFLRRLP